MPSFTVTTAGQRVDLDAAGAAQAPFTVTNTGAQTLRARLLVKPSEPARAEWLSIVGEPSRDLAPNASEQVVVQLNVPLATPPGSYTFRLDAVSEAEPDEDFTEGPSVAFDVAPPPQPKRRFPWWIVAIVGAVVLLIIIGVVLWLVTRDDGRRTSPVPDVTGRSEPAARAALSGAGFTPAVVRVRVPLEALVGTVRGQDPPPQSQQPEGTVVTIRVGVLLIRPPPPIRR